MTTAKKKLGIFLVIVIISVAWNIIVPGIVAYYDGVFYQAGIESKFPKHSRISLARYQHFNQQSGDLNEKIALLDSQVTVLSKISGAGDAIKNCLNLKQEYHTQLSELKSPLIVSPFYNNRSVYYTLTAYIVLAVLVFLIMPVHVKRLRFSKIFINGLFIYAGWMFTSWLRNFVFYDEGRTIFSYVNADISLVSFLLQELRTLGMCLLIASLWSGWMIYIEEIYQEIKNWKKKTFTLQHLTFNAAMVSRMFKVWQLNSVFIVLAFLPWTIFYWTNVMKFGDSRYVVPALIMHLYWTISWVLVTIPTLLIYNRWINLKNNILAQSAAKPGEDTGLNKAIILTREVNPLSTLQIFGSGIISIASFVYPLINLFK